MPKRLQLNQAVSEYLGTDMAHVESLAAVAPKTYRRYTVPKRGGHGLRTIYHPARKTKALQYALIEVLLNLLPVHKAAFAYRRGLRAPLLKHADVHRTFSYSVRIDFADFFPSIVPDDLFRTIDVSGIMAGGLTTGEREFLSNALFLKHHGRMCLGIGAPSSPAISNAVMLDLDKAFATYAEEHDSRYTRYADDIVFSTAEQGLCASFVQHVVDTLAATPSPSLSVNTSKTLFMSRGTRRAITGLFVTPEGKVSLGRHRKRRLRSFVHKYMRYRNGEVDMPRPERDWLKGNLAFALDVEPDYYNRLVQRYSATVLNAALHDSG